MSRGQITIESVELVKSTAGRCVFTCTVKNVGDKPAKSITVKLANEAEADFQGVSGSSLLEPGRTAATILSSGSGLRNDYVGGQTYTLVVKAVFVDGSTLSTIRTVTCVGGGSAWTSRVYPPSQPIINSILLATYFGSRPHKAVSVDLESFVIKMKNSTLECDELTFYCASGAWLYGIYKEGGSEPYYLVCGNPEKLTIERRVSLPLQVWGWVVDVTPKDGYLYVGAIDSDENGDYYWMKIFEVDSAAFQVVRSAAPLMRGNVFGQTDASNLAVEGGFLYAFVRSYNEGYNNMWWEIVKISLFDFSLAYNRTLSGLETWFTPATSVVLVEGYLYLKTDPTYLNGSIYKIDPATLIVIDDLQLPSDRSFKSLCAINDELYVAGVTSDGNIGPSVTKYYYNFVRVNLDRFEREAEKETWTGVTGGIYMEFMLWTDGAYIYSPYFDGSHLYIVKVQPVTLEVIDTLLLE